MTFKLITIYIMSLFYILMGLKHLFDPKYFLPMMPTILPYKNFIIYLTGLIEIILGSLLAVEEYRFYVATGLIIFLVLIFPANIYLYTSEIARDILKISKSQALFRMPFQITLIILAYWHSIEKSSKKFSILNLIIFIPTILYFILISL